jgi:hypothetical protein
MTHHIAAYLISMAVGYWVLTLAAKEKGANQKIGKWIGWIIIVISLFGPLCIGACHVFCRSQSGFCNSSASCHWSSGMMNCPEMGKGMMNEKEKTGDTDKAK